MGQWLAIEQRVFLKKERNFRPIRSPSRPPQRRNIQNVRVGSVKTAKDKMAVSQNSGNKEMAALFIALQIQRLPEIVSPAGNHRHLSLHIELNL
jgi:hypothetical protein